MPAFGRFCFPRDNRIVTAGAYASTKQRGTRIITRLFILYLAESTDGVSRIGIIASRKVGNAVQRNRCKRLLREVFRLNRHDFARPLEIVVIVKKKPYRPTYGDYERDFRQGISTYNKRSGVAS